MAAVVLLALRVQARSVADAPLLVRFVSAARTWALVDPLAANVVGVLAERETASRCLRVSGHGAEHVEEYAQEQNGAREQARPTEHLEQSDVGSRQLGACLGAEHEHRQQRDPE
jgi:hypothetical protein